MPAPKPRKKYKPLADYGYVPDDYSPENLSKMRAYIADNPKAFNKQLDKIAPDPYRGTRKLASMLIQQYPERFPDKNPDNIVNMLEQIAYTESTNENKVQMKGGPGRGYYQIETTTAPVAANRYKNYQGILKDLSEVPLPKFNPKPGPKVWSKKAKGLIPTANVMNLSKDQQAMLALSNMSAAAGDRGTINPADPMNTWLNYHWAGSAEERPARIAHWEDAMKTFKGIQTPPKKQQHGGWVYPANTAYPAYGMGGRLTEEGKKVRKYGPRPDYMNQNPSGMTTGPITQRSIGNTPGGGYMSFEDGGNTAYESWYRYNTPEGREGIPESYSSYDYQRYYNDAVRGLNPMGFDEGSQHFPDTYKYPWHPTFSDESIYYTNQKETPALSYNTKADWKEYLKSKKSKLKATRAKGGWTGYPDHTMYSSGMERFDRVRDYTKYADGGNITPYNISDPAEFKRANRAYQDSLSLSKSNFYIPFGEDIYKNVSELNRRFKSDIGSVGLMRDDKPVPVEKYQKGIQPVDYADLEHNPKQYEEYAPYTKIIYKKPVRKPIYIPEPSKPEYNIIQHSEPMGPQNMEMPKLVDFIMTPYGKISRVDYEKQFGKKVTERDLRSKKEKGGKVTWQIIK